MSNSNLLSLISGMAPLDEAELQSMRGMLLNEPPFLISGLKEADTGDAGINFLWAAEEVCFFGTATIYDELLIAVRNDILPVDETRSRIDRIKTSPIAESFEVVELKNFLILRYSFTDPFNALTMNIGEGSITRDQPLNSGLPVSRLLLSSSQETQQRSEYLSLTGCKLSHSDISFPKANDVEWFITTMLIARS